MARITKVQKAGLDFLDQVFFNELIVHQGMNDEERQQLDTVVRRVTELTERQYSGREAEIIKHLAYYFLEVCLSNTTAEWVQAFPVKALPADLSWQTVEAVDNFKGDVQKAFMLALTDKSMGVESTYALQIAETLKDEFAGYSALVRGDLPRRCFAYEFRDASVGVYCWLTVAGVLPVTKNGPERIVSEFDEHFITRLTLLADYEMITHGLRVMISKDNSGCVFLGHPEFNLKEATIDRLLDVQKVFNEAMAKSSLRSIPLMHRRDLTDATQVQRFFEQWGSRKARLRTHTGTLASWLGVLGAAMVERQLFRAYAHAAQEQFKLGVESVVIADLKVAAIFNACDNQHTITECVRERLAEHGLSINPDTLYRSHSKMKKTLQRLVNLYCKLARDAGVVMPAIYDDTFYASTFIHADKLPH